MNSVETSKGAKAQIRLFCYCDDGDEAPVQKFPKLSEWKKVFNLTIGMDTTKLVPSWNFHDNDVQINSEHTRRQTKFIHAHNSDAECVCMYVRFV